MELYYYPSFSIALAIGTFLMILFLALKHKNLLKEQKSDNKLSPPYSFSRVQLLLWTLIICPAFCLNWGFSEKHTPFINDDALILLGIVSGVTLTSGIISNVKINNNKLAKDVINITSLKMNLESSNFFSDILKDDDGNFSIPRLQNLVFTMAFLGIFIVSFLANWKMEYPDFDSKAYVLMGITSSTYLIGKGLSK